MTRRILGFVYVNAHRALWGAALAYAESLRAHGFTVDIIDLATPGVYQELDQSLRREHIAFCFAPQGVGSRLGNDTQSIWKQRRIPFVGIHGDHPCYNIFNHFSDTEYVANMYLYESFADVSRRYIKTSQYIGTLPFHVYDMNPSPFPFHERPIRMLFLKSGESVDECVNMLNNLPTPIRNGVWEQLERMRHNPNLQICDLVQEIFDYHKIDRAQDFDLFWGCAHWMDMYIRRKRAIDMVEWLKMQVGAVIVGNGWDFIDRTNARAEFRPSVDLSKSALLYQTSKIICNTSPYGSDILHERVAAGLMNGSIVISDTNAWWDKNYSDIPALKRFNWGQSLDEQLLPVLQMSTKEGEAQALSGRAKTKAIFNEKDQAENILACVRAIDSTCLP